MPDAIRHTVFLANEADTLALGRALGTSLEAPTTIWLEGDLGAGKTTLVRGLLRGLGYTGAVKSPTYTIVENYKLDKFTLNHFDLYRFHTPDEWLDAGLDDLFDTHSVALIEWPQQGKGFVPVADVNIHWEFAPSGRTVLLTAMSAVGLRLITSLTESS